MYYLAVVLPLALNDKILVLKQWIKERWGCTVALKSPAHITLVPPFWMAVEKESALRCDMETVSQTLTAFALSTDNFSAFRPRTLFVAVAPNEQLNAVKKAVDIFFQQSDYQMKIESRPFHPHITIATRDLRKKDFDEAWLHFQRLSFCETADINGLSLLRHNGRAWDVVFTAPFATTDGAML